jgi:hypothetical protein
MMIRESRCSGLMAVANSTNRAVVCVSAP